MPKEYVNANQELNMNRIRTGWNKEAGHVELATVGPDDDQRSFFVDLDRSGINRLIRVLRRARDQAFGRDE